MISTAFIASCSTFPFFEKGMKDRIEEIHAVCCQCPEGPLKGLEIFSRPGKEMVHDLFLSENGDIPDIYTPEDVEKALREIRPCPKTEREIFLDGAKEALANLLSRQESYVLLRNKTSLLSKKIPESLWTVPSGCWITEKLGKQYLVFPWIPAGDEMKTLSDYALTCLAMDAGICDEMGIEISGCRLAVLDTGRMFFKIFEYSQEVIEKRISSLKDCLSHFKDCFIHEKTFSVMKKKSAEPRPWTGRDIENLLSMEERDLFLKGAMEGLETERKLFLENIRSFLENFDGKPPLTYHRFSRKAIISMFIIEKVRVLYPGIYMDCCRLSMEPDPAKMQAVLEDMKVPREKWTSGVYEVSAKNFVQKCEKKGLGIRHSVSLSVRSSDKKVRGILQKNGKDAVKMLKSKP